MMNEPPLDLLMEKVDSRYTLVVVAAKRARIITDTDDGEDERLRKPISAALKEIAADRVTFRRPRLR
ncbi:MAG TPA: DNA-directed RNA polymerase subunit omega [Spirochaetia bacterium]|nr:DNA-directed RNA polymerase subunit omega [Spirochaetia bacterium]